MVFMIKSHYFRFYLVGVALQNVHCALLFQKPGGAMCCCIFCITQLFGHPFESNSLQIRFHLTQGQDAIHLEINRAARSHITRFPDPIILIRPYICLWTIDRCGTLTHAIQTCGLLNQLAGIIA